MSNKDKADLNDKKQHLDKATKEKILEMARLCDGCLEKSYADDGCYSCENRGIYDGATKMAEWKNEQFEEERKELLTLVEMLPVDERNQSIIEDLIGMLR